MSYIYHRDMISADIHDERSDIYFTVSGLTYDELQDLISYQKTFRVELIYNDLDDYDPPLPEFKDELAERHFY